MVKYSFEVSKLIAGLSLPDRETAERHIVDDLGLAMIIAANVIRMGRLEITFVDEGMISGTTQDIEILINEIYRGLRVQRAIAAPFSAVDRVVLEQEQKEYGF